MRRVRRAIEEHVLFDNTGADPFKVTSVVKIDLNIIHDIGNVMHVASRAWIETVVNRHLGPALETSARQVTPDKAQASSDQNFLFLHTRPGFLVLLAMTGLAQS